MSIGKTAQTIGNFELDENYYHQMTGTVPGTKVAPLYTNISMSSLRTSCVYLHLDQPLLCLKFIDDIFLIWALVEERLQFSIKHLNEVHPNIKIFLECHTMKIPFLDLLLCANDSTLHT